MNSSTKKIYEELLKAEEMYLLSTHPLNESDVASVPPPKSSDKWAEPGWQLNLDVHEFIEVLFIATASCTVVPAVGKESR